LADYYLDSKTSERHGNDAATSPDHQNTQCCRLVIGHVRHLFGGPNSFLARRLFHEKSHAHGLSRTECIHQREHHYACLLLSVNQTPREDTTFAGLQKFKGGNEYNGK